MSISSLPSSPGNHEKPIHKLYEQKEHFSPSLIRQITKRMNIASRDKERISDEWIDENYKRQCELLGEELMLLVPDVIAFDKATRKPYFFSKGKGDYIILLPLSHTPGEAIRFLEEKVEKREMDFREERNNTVQRVDQLIPLREWSENQTQAWKQIGNFQSIPSFTKEQIQETFHRFMEPLHISSQAKSYISSTYIPKPFFEKSEYGYISRIIASYLPEDGVFEILPFQLERVKPLKNNFSYLPVLVQDTKNSLSEVHLMPASLYRGSYVVRIPFEQNIVERSEFLESGMSEVKRMLTSAFFVNECLRYSLTRVVDEKVRSTPERIWFLGMELIEKKVKTEEKVSGEETVTTTQDPRYIFSYDRAKKQMYFVNANTGEESSYSVHLARFLTRPERISIPSVVSLEALFAQVQNNIRFFSVDRDKILEKKEHQGLFELEKNRKSLSEKYAMDERAEDLFMRGVFYHTQGLRARAREQFAQIPVKNNLQEILLWEKEMDQLGMNPEATQILLQGGVSPLNIRRLKEVAYLNIRDNNLLSEETIQKYIQDFNTEHHTSYTLFSSNILCIIQKNKLRCVLVKDGKYADQLKLFPLVQSPQGLINFETHLSKGDLVKDTAIFINALQWLVLFDQNSEIKNFENVLPLPKDIRQVLKNAYDVRSKFFVGVEGMSSEEYSLLIENFTLSDIMKFTSNSWELYTYLTKRQDTHNLSTLTINLTMNAANWGSNARRMEFISKLKRYILLSKTSFTKLGRSSQEHEKAQQKELITVGKVFEPIVMFLLDEHIRKRAPEVPHPIFASDNRLNAKGVDMFVYKKTSKGIREYVAVDLSVKDKKSQLYFPGYKIYEEHYSKKIHVLEKDSSMRNATHMGIVHAHKNLLLPLGDGMGFLESIGTLLDNAELFPVEYNKQTHKLQSKGYMNFQVLGEELEKYLAPSYINEKKSDVFLEEYLEGMYKKIIE